METMKQWIIKENDKKSTNVMFKNLLGIKLITNGKLITET